MDVGQLAASPAMPIRFGRDLAPGLATARRLSLTTRRHEAAVMLHLRARYVSKAAILGVPGQIVPAENRSPI
jgi:hypothetical protein